MVAGTEETWAYSSSDEFWTTVAEVEYAVGHDPLSESPLVTIAEAIEQDLSGSIQNQSP